MASVSRGVRALSPYLGLLLGLVLAACGGGSSGKKDAASGTDLAAGDADGSDGGAGTAGQGTAGTTGTAGQGAHDGGAAGAGGSAGADAGGDVATDAGAAGNDGGTTDAAGSDGGVAGSEGGVAGSSGSDGGDAATATDAPLVGGLCDPFPIQSPVVTPTIINNGKAPDTAGFTGGTLASGTYYMTAVVHFGATYTGPTQEVLVIDAASKTGVDASVVGTTTKYVGDTISFPSATVITGTPSCGGTTATSANYLVTGTGAGSTLSLNAVGSSDIKVFTKQ